MPQRQLAVEIPVGQELVHLLQVHLVMPRIALIEGDDPGDSGAVAMSVLWESSSDASREAMSPSRWTTRPSPMSLPGGSNAGS
jgi:hypothetical protein